MLSIMLPFLYVRTIDSLAKRHYNKHLTENKIVEIRLTDLRLFDDDNYYFIFQYQFI